MDGGDKIGKVGEEIDRKVTLVALRSFFVWEWGFWIVRLNFFEKFLFFEKFF